MATTGSPITAIPHGAALTSITIPSLPSHNLILSLPSDELYETHNKGYFGETIGRVANRLDNATVPSLNGRSYKLPANDGTNCLHGGGAPPSGGCWGKRKWAGPAYETRRGERAQKWELVSPHMDGGLPGEVTAIVWYTISTKTPAAGSRKDEISLTIEYEARMTGDPSKEDGVSETVVALANHSYYNPSSGPTLATAEANFASVDYLPVDKDTKIPTGPIEQYPGVKANVWTTFGNDLTMDHCFVLDKNAKNVPIDTREGELRRAITQRASSPDGNGTIYIEIRTTEPAVQLYTGDGINVAPDADGKPLKGWENRGARAGMAIEPERYINAAGSGGLKEGWRDMVTLRRGEVWGSMSTVTCWLE
ncbi:MAG: hypothetical protein M1828_003735 [Chrysothrix sp. TS-e1954]|nr:MAG: hypothetical protein M1828_003735 [Chrysothrix sp. TS-e1954]